MISRISARRLLCCLMAALTLFGALSPALCQPAEAVAVADDVLIASLGLLAMSWAGISFSSCAGAQTAVNSFLASKPAAKLSLAGLLTKGLVTEGTKLLLTGDVRDVFSAVLPDIRDFFQAKSDSVVSSGGGLLSGSVVSESLYPGPVITNSSNTSYDDYMHAVSELSPLAIFPSSSGYKYEFCFTLESGSSITYTSKYFSDSGFWIYYGASVRYHIGDSDFHPLFVPFVVHHSNGKSNLCFAYYVDGKPILASSWNSFDNVVSVTTRLVSAPDTVDFKQSKEVDGTSALEILAPAPLYVVNPGGSSGGDGSQKPEIDFSKVAFISLAGLYGLLGLSGNDALKDPGLDPEQMVDQLKKAMESTQTEPKPDPDPQPDPDPDTPGGSSGTAPDFNGMMLPGLKDFFPFCIPFDLKKMMDALCADPVAPKFTFATSFLGQVYTVDIDLSAWDGVATTVRYMVVATYIVCLAVATRKFIKW